MLYGRSATAIGGKSVVDNAILPGYEQIAKLSFDAHACALAQHCTNLSLKAQITVLANHRLNSRKALKCNN